MEQVLNTYYEEAKEELLDQVEGYINDSLISLKGQGGGSYHLSTIGDRTIEAFERILALRNLSTKGGYKKTIFDVDMNSREVSLHLCSLIDNELGALFKETKQQYTWLIDFKIYSVEIENKFLALASRVANLSKLNSA
ncbi:MAG: hypothetical protein K5694_06925 [Bacilli bacterium]|nr:hypothetical protein [Bacilli bacterium]